MKYPEYYKCFSGDEDGDGFFTTGKIYKIKNPEYLEEMENFIDDKGQSNGWGGTNYKHFEPSTIEEWNIHWRISSCLLQMNIGIPIPMTG